MVKTDTRSVLNEVIERCPRRQLAAEPSNGTLMFHHPRRQSCRDGVVELRPMGTTMLSAETDRPADDQEVACTTAMGLRVFAAGSTR